VTAGVRVPKRLFNVAGLGMLFIGYPTGYLISVFATADIGTTNRFGCLIGLTFFLIGAFGVAARRLTDRHGLRDSAPVALLALAIPALAIPLLADRPVALLPLGYLGCLCALELGGNVLATALVCGGLLGVGIAVGLPAAVAILLASQSTVLAVLVAGWARQCAAIRALAAARTREAETAVAAERVRFGRDLHDLVGHTLSTITLKAQVAARLLTRQPGRAEAEIDAVIGLSRSLLAETRQAVRGYRETSLAGELAAAGTALDAAEIQAELPATCPELPAQVAATMSWVLRESVTNVVRHSRARRCTVTVTEDRRVARMRVHDDGVGLPPERIRGSGLAGMAERAQLIGARLHIAAAAGGGLLVELAAPLGGLS